jgi:hypothetical protein
MTANEQARKRELYSRAERYLDGCQGSCVLRNPVAGRIVQDALRFYHNSLFQIHAWCVMPNHVHCLLTPSHDFPLMEILERAKGIRLLKSTVNSEGTAPFGKRTTSIGSSGTRDTSIE